MDITETELSYPNVVLALESLSLYQYVKEAEAAVCQWQSSSHDTLNQFVCLLLAATLDSVEIQLPAILTLKSVLTSKVWKRSGNPSSVGGRGGVNVNYPTLNEDTKEQIRHVLLTMICSPTQHPLLHDASIPTELKRRFNAEIFAKQKVAVAAVSSTLAKIVVMDLPKESVHFLPTFVESISRAVSTIDSQQYPTQQGFMPHLIARNASIALETVVEQLSQKILLRQYYVQFGAAQLPVIVETFAASLRWSSLSRTESSVVLLEEYINTMLFRSISHLLQACMTKLLIEYGNIRSSMDDFFSMLCEYLRSATKPSEMLEDMWEMILLVQKDHAVAFGRFLLPYLQFFWSVLDIDETSATKCAFASLSSLHNQLMQANSSTFVTDSKTSLSTQRLTIDTIPQTYGIKALHFISNVIGCESYRLNHQSDQTLIRQTEIADQGDKLVSVTNLTDVSLLIWERFLTPTRVVSLTDACLGRFMPMSEDRLLEWLDSPEEFFLAEEDRAADEDISSAAQSLYCSVLESARGRPIVLSRLSELLTSTELQLIACQIEALGQRDEVKANTLKLWDSIYLAAGLSAAAVEEEAYFPLDDWLLSSVRSVLGLLLSRSSPAQSTALARGETSPTDSLAPILRRRLVWLVGCYASDLPEGFRVFGIALHLLSSPTSPENDLVVKLECIKTMSTCLSNFVGAASDSIVVTEAIITALFSFLTELTEVRTEEKVLECVSLTLGYITGMGEELSVGSANASVVPLPQLWEACIGERLMLRSHILQILSGVAQGVTEDEIKVLYPIAIPIMSFILEDKQREQLFLTDVALRLFLVLARLSPSYTNEFGLLFMQSVKLLEEDFQHLRLIAKTALPLVVKGGSNFLSSHSVSLTNLSHLTLGKVRPVAAQHNYLVLETLLKDNPGGGSGILVRDGVLTDLLGLVMTNHFGVGDFDPDRVVALYLNLIARIGLHSAELVESALPISLENGMSFSAYDLIASYLRLFNAVDVLYEGNRALCEKLWLFFLMSLIPSPSKTTITINLSAAISNLAPKLLETYLKFQERIPNNQTLVKFTLLEDEDEDDIPSGVTWRDAMEALVTRDVVNRSDLVELLRTKMNPEVLAKVDATSFLKLNQILTKSP